MQWINAKEALPKEGTPVAQRFTYNPPDLHIVNRVSYYCQSYVDAHPEYILTHWIELPEFPKND